MNSRSLLHKFLAIFSLLGVACQTYDFEPVEPLAIAQTTQVETIVARQLKPNLMLLVDKSGSMDIAINDSAPGCNGGCGTSKNNLCPASCPTRWTELQKAMGEFLGQANPVGHMGMTAFPSDAICGSPGQVRIELDGADDLDVAQMAGTTATINQTIQGIKSACLAGEANCTGGGTPTGNALAFLGNYARLRDPLRDNFILVLTDGLPNCNSNNANTCNQPTSCRCTLAGGACSGQFCTQGCLDRDGSVAQVRILRANDIKTIVVGFGADTASGDGPEILNAMAEEGGFARVCPNGTDAECGSNNRCIVASRACEKKFYQAANGGELAKALEEIGKLVGRPDPCKYILDSVPSNPNFVAVIIDGISTKTGPDTWSYQAGAVVLNGQLCTRAHNSTPAFPLKIEIRVVEGL